VWEFANCQNEQVTVFSIGLEESSRSRLELVMTLDLQLGKVKVLVRDHYMPMDPPNHCTDDELEEEEEEVMRTGHKERLVEEAVGHTLVAAQSQCRQRNDLVCVDVCSMIKGSKEVEYLLHIQLG
jgi:hypothetical protein